MTSILNHFGKEDQRKWIIILCDWKCGHLFKTHSFLVVLLAYKYPWVHALEFGVHWKPCIISKAHMASLVPLRCMSGEIREPTFIILSRVWIYRGQAICYSHPWFVEKFIRECVYGESDAKFFKVQMIHLI